MYVLLEVDEEGTPIGDSVWSSLVVARLERQELNESGDGDPVYRVFELREVD